jgi:hypothetical protein
LLEALGTMCRGSLGSSALEVLALHAPTVVAQMPALLDGPLRFFHFYLVLADVFGWPTVSRGFRLRSDGLAARTKSATSCRAHGLARVSETSQN